MGALVGVLFVAGAIVGMENPYRWLGLVGMGPLWAGLLVAGLLVLGVVVARTKPPGPSWIPMAGAFCCAAAAVSVAALAALASVITFDGGGGTRVVDVSADGGLRLVMHDTSNVIDPVVALYVESDDGFFSKRAFLGCRNSDGGVGWIDSARFGGPDTVVVEAERRWTLTIDPDGVRAIDTLSKDMCLPGLYTG
ncbi:hypothetical protein GCM10010182_53330 [Actinomadura cremea]|nr:hypothetical protein GCM10010182_53330 [Actinomadura cremea]